MRRRTFLTRFAGIVASGMAVGCGATASAATTYYVSYTYYRKDVRTGRVYTVSTGSAGPFYSLRAAQSSVDWYNSQDSRSGNNLYYYSARIR